MVVESRMNWCSRLYSVRRMSVALGGVDPGGLSGASPQRVPVLTACRPPWWTGPKYLVFQAETLALNSEVLPTAGGSSTWDRCVGDRPGD